MSPVLMFALPFVFLIPGLALALVGSVLVWLGRRHAATPSMKRGVGPKSE